jgi:hypothetical protein
MPQAVYADELHITRNGAIHVGSIVLAGSNNGTAWSLISTHLNMPPWTIDQELVTGAQRAYTHFRLIVLKNYGGQSAIIVDMRLVEYARQATTRSQLFWPPARLPSNTTTLYGQSYGNGAYTASASSTFINNQTVGPYRLFDGGLGGWLGGQDTYAVGTPGAYLGAVSTTVSGVAYTGEWVQLQLPTAVRADELHLTYTQAEAQVGSGIIAGSNDGTTWMLISTHLNMPLSTTTPHVLVTGALQSYTRSG